MVVLVSSFVDNRWYTFHWSLMPAAKKSAQVSWHIVVVGLNGRKKLNRLTLNCYCVKIMVNPCVCVCVCVRVCVFVHRHAESAVHPTHGEVQSTESQNARRKLRQSDHQFSALVSWHWHPRSGHHGTHRCWVINCGPTGFERFDDIVNFFQRNVCM